MNNIQFIDSSAANRTVTVSGTGLTQCAVGPTAVPVGTTYNPAVHGASMFNSSGANSISMSAAASLAPGTGDFTFECWFKPTSNVFGVFLRLAPYAAYRNADGSVVWGHDSFGINTIPAANGMPLNKWTHYAFSRQSGTTRYFINGILQATQVDSNNYSWGSSPLYIGNNDGSTNFIGYLSGYHLVVGTALYTANFTPSIIPTAVANTQLLLKFANIGIVDYVAKTPIFVRGAVDSVTTQAKYGSRSLFFPGTTSDYIELSTTSNPRINVSNLDFTIEFWLRPTSATRMGIFAYSSDFSLGMDYHYNGTRNVNMWASSNGSSWDMIHSDAGGAGIGTQSLTLNAWNHVAMTRQGSTFRSFVNGVLDKTATSSAGIYTLNRNFIIGKWGNNTLPLNAYIDDFSFKLGIAKYTATFTPPAQLATS